jgi:hypothetical protein
MNTDREWHESAQTITDSSSGKDASMTSGRGEHVNTSGSKHFSRRQKNQHNNKEWSDQMEYEDTLLKEREEEEEAMRREEYRKEQRKMEQKEKERLAEKQRLRKEREKARQEEERL